MSFFKDCIVAVRQDGTPTGRIEKIGGVDTYVALPEGDYPKDKAVLERLWFQDIFGIKFPNNQLRIYPVPVPFPFEFRAAPHDFARNGFQVYMPDYLHGDPVNDALFADPNWDINRDWFPTHTEEYTRPLLDAVIVGLKERGVTVFGATAYCFGGRYSLDLAFENLVHAIAITHPSAISTPSDFEKLLSTSRVPLLINSCEVDLMFPIEDQKKADEVLGGGKYKWGYERTCWEGCVHGFAVRGDMSDPLVKAGKEGAFKATVEWFIRYL